jgi:hypothetical protein
MLLTVHGALLGSSLAVTAPWPRLIVMVLTPFLTTSLVGGLPTSVTPVPASTEV